MEEWKCDYCKENKKPEECIAVSIVNIACIECYMKLPLSYHISDMIKMVNTTLFSTVIDAPSNLEMMLNTWNERLKQVIKWEKEQKERESKK